MTTIPAPKEVFAIFDEIRQIPRPSKHEEKISQWLVDFASTHGLECERDDAMNVLMCCPATKGYENHPAVLLQAHMDMVCEKNNDIKHDFSTDPIQTYVDGEWLRAKGTTLGADDGIGMAMALAAMTSPDVKHPALECLFTVDEETGLTGAFRLKDGWLTAKRLINLDSEDDGQIFIGCAGGIDTFATLAYTPIVLPQIEEKWFAARVSVGGLMGGHSGDDINKGRGNANQLLVRFLYRIMKQTHLLLSYIKGGNLRNAIAREAEAVLCVPFSYREQLRIELNHYIAEVENEIKDVEKELHIDMESDNLPATVFPNEITQKLLLSLYACPHGVVGMCKDMPGLVETSTNLASIKTFPDHIEINTSQRSSVESLKHDIKNKVEAALLLSGAEVKHGDGYPGWKPNVKSDLLKVAVEAYHHVAEGEPEVRAIHAGLECGLFLEKYPNLDMISVGPQMVGVHSPLERLNIPSTQKTWNWLKQILAML